MTTLFLRLTSLKSLLDFEGLGSLPLTALGRAGALGQRSVGDLLPYYACLRIGEVAALDVDDRTKKREELMQPYLPSLVGQIGNLPVNFIISVA